MTERLPPRLRLSFPLFRYSAHRRRNVASCFLSLLLPAESARTRLRSDFPPTFPPFAAAPVTDAHYWKRRLEIEQAESGEREDLSQGNSN